MSVAALNIAGLVMNLIGVILLFRYGMPFRVRTEGASYELREEVDQTAIAADRRYTALGWIGLALILLGTAAQIKANCPKSMLEAREASEPAPRSTPQALAGRRSSAFRQQFSGLIYCQTAICSFIVWASSEGQVLPRRNLWANLFSAWPLWRFQRVPHRPSGCTPVTATRLMVTVTRATATQLRLHSTITRLPDTATQVMGHRPRQERPLLS
jgi:hypothetical protein